MLLYEYEGRFILELYDIEKPKGYLARDPREVFTYVKLLGGRAFLKAQVLGSGRKRAGGVLFVNSPTVGEEVARKLFESKVLGQRVSKVLVVEPVNIFSEIYVGFIVNPVKCTVSLLASPYGGIDVEELSKRKLLRIEIDPLIGLTDFTKREAFKFLNLPKPLFAEFSALLEKLYEIFNDYDCVFLEVNPLALTRDQRLVVIDFRMSIDDNSLFRHPDFESEYLSRLSEREVVARKFKFSLVELDGDVGVIGNGAGLTMATMDLIVDLGMRPAFFLDIGGGASSDRVREAVKIALSYPKVKGLLINILGGITRCDEVARGIVEALEVSKHKKPMVVRLSGTNEEEGRRILESNGIKYFTSMEEAIEEAAKLFGEANGDTSRQSN